MSEIITVDPSTGRGRVAGATTDLDGLRPNVVDVGAWLTQAKSLRDTVTDYVPRHRAPGPAL